MSEQLRMQPFEINDAKLVLIMEVSKKTYEKPGVGFMSFPSFWEMKSS